MTTPIPTQDHAASVQGIALRATRLAADGTLQTGVEASYAMDRFVSATYTPTMDGATNITLQGANGAMLVAYRTKDVLLQADLTVSVADPDPEFSEIVAGGTIFTDNTVPTAPVTDGWAPAPVGTISNPNGCALEVWSAAIVGGRRAAVKPFFQYVFPAAFLDKTGDTTFENGVAGHTFSGYSQSNSGFGTGPDKAWKYTSALPYQHARVATAPTGINNYVAVTA